MNTVDDYINSYAGLQKEWIERFVAFMRENYPGIQETISYKMPMYKFNGIYIAFSIAKDHFTFHTLDFAMIEELKQLLPEARFGKGCAKIKFGTTAAIPVLFNATRRIIERSEKEQPVTK